MGKIVELQGEGGILRLDIGTDGWCRCHLLASENIYLGAERIQHLIHRLFKFLNEDQSEPIGEIWGHKVRWVLSLSEAHCTLYVASPDSERILFWENAEGKLVGTMKLRHTQCSEWRKRLESLLSEGLD